MHRGGFLGGSLEIIAERGAKRGLVSGRNAQPV
jgi:hypothetical protein